MNMTILHEEVNFIPSNGVISTVTVYLERDGFKNRTYIGYNAYWKQCFLLTVTNDGEGRKTYQRFLNSNHLTVKRLVYASKQEPDGEQNPEEIYE